MPRESNNLHIYGNKDSMNLNSMILTNIQSSNYFKVNLYELKRIMRLLMKFFIELVSQVKVRHLEPWEKGSRKTQGLTGMCGGVRGVGGGGIVSTAFCILYKLYTLKLTRKQVLGLMVHKDSPFIRGLGFMYVRYTQAPHELWDWYEPYLDDPEEIDVKAGGGYVMTIGNMLKQWLTRLEWFETLFPRIPVPIQTDIQFKMKQKYGIRVNEEFDENAFNGKPIARRTPPPEIVEAVKRSNYKSKSRSRSRSKSNNRIVNEVERSRSKSRSRSRSVSSSRASDKEHKLNGGSKEKKHHHHRRHKHRKHHSSKRDSKSRDEHERERDREHRHHRSHHKHRHRHHHRDSSTDKKERKSRSPDMKKKRTSSP